MESFYQDLVWSLFHVAITLEFGMQRVPGEVGPGGAITQPARLYIFMYFYICIHTYIYTHIYIYVCAYVIIMHVRVHVLILH